MWNEQPIETLLKARLAADHGDTKGDTYWSAYVTTRDELERQILTWIASKEPDLTDHGIDHIANVMENAGLILGHPGNRTQINATATINTLTSKELLLLLMGCLLHDVGNIRGRKQHNLTGLDVWKQSGHSYDMWTQEDRRTITAICRAHTGKAENGSADTLQPLSTTNKYFRGEGIRATELAAVLRLADELAEGPQRTSQFLLNQGLYSSSSEPYHFYASCTQIIIDHKGGRIALTYDIDLDNRLLCSKKTGKRQFLEFMRLVYQRILKLEHERVFARHYAPGLIAFRETSVAVHFSRASPELNWSLPPLVLNDFNAKSSNPDVLSALNASYSIDQIATSLYPDGGSNGKS